MLVSQNVSTVTENQYRTCTPVQYLWHEASWTMFSSHIAGFILYSSTLFWGNLKYITPQCKHKEMPPDNTGEVKTITTDPEIGMHFQIPTLVINQHLFIHKRKGTRVRLKKFYNMVLSKHN